MFRAPRELAAMVRSGECSASKLVAISLRRIEELNPQLNAFVARSTQSERSETAAEVDPGRARPFAGVPIAIKTTAR